MAQSAGRDFLLKKNGTTIASITQVGLNWSATPIDTTNADDDAATSFLSDEFATTAMEISATAFSDDSVLEDLAFSTGGHSAQHLSDITITHPNGDVISGNFILTSLNLTGSHDGAMQYDVTLVRNGLHTFTQA